MIVTGVIKRYMKNTDTEQYLEENSGVEILVYNEENTKKVLLDCVVYSITKDTVVFDTNDTRIEIPICNIDRWVEEGWREQRNKELYNQSENNLSKYIMK